MVVEYHVEVAVSMAAGVRIVVSSEAEAEEVSRTLEAGGAPAKTMKQVEDGSVQGVVPVFVWIVFSAVLAVASLAEIVTRWTRVNGCSAVISVNKHGEVEVDEKCNVKGLVILKDKDGKLTYAERKVLDLEDVLKAVTEKGIDAAAELLKKADGKEGDPSTDDAEPEPAAE